MPEIPLSGPFPAPKGLSFGRTLPSRHEKAGGKPGLPPASCAGKRLPQFSMLLKREQTSAPLPRKALPSAGHT